MDLIEASGLGVAAFAAGAINSIAGGGTLITFPALIAAGYGAKVANFTNTVAVWPGTVGGSLAYRREIVKQKHHVAKLALPTVLGAILGSALLLSTPESTFERLVPFLILSACALLMLQDQITQRVFSNGRELHPDRSMMLLQVGIFFVSIYGGYFGAGIGIITLALFGLFLPEDIQHANALKGLVAFTINGLAAVYFALFAEVAWEAGILMAVCALAGGYAGASVARLLPRQRLRQVATVYGIGAAIVMIFF